MNNFQSQTNSNPYEFKPFKPVMKVIGLGGGGSNAVNRMIELGLPGIDFIAANTDAQALKSSLAPTKVQIGPLITRGLGAGGNPQIGYDAARESVQNLADALEGADMVFLTAGMGGGTGTGAISIAAQVAKHMGAVTIAIVTTPFGFEMGRRQANAQEGLARLRQQVDTLITIPNDRLLKIAPRDLPLDMAFRLADDVLRQGIQGISELINQTGYINIDFTEALVAIDVNTGRYVGKRNLQETILKTNLEAAKEIAYQLRLRNIGGIIIVDFIDMDRQADREKVSNALMDALKKDKQKTNILKISELGLVQMTRKRTRESLTRTLCVQCPYCEGKGFLKSKTTVCYEILRAIVKNISYDCVGAMKVTAHPEIIKILFEQENDKIVHIQHKHNILIHPNPDPNLHQEHYEVSCL